MMAPEPAPPSASPEADRGTELARLSRVVAHELRNPLSAVKIALQTLERHTGLSERDQRRLAIALAEVGTMETVLRNLVDWARPPPLTLEPVDLRRPVEAALEAVRAILSEKSLSIRREGGEGALVVRGDGQGLARALGELLDNAARASPEGARITVRLARRDDRAVVQVIDVGAGFEPGDLPRAFEPFFRRAARGLGLGLARARDLACRHGGEVTLASDAAGTTATLALPLA